MFILLMVQLRITALTSILFSKRSPDSAGRHQRERRTDQASQQLLTVPFASSFLTWLVWYSYGTELVPLHCPTAIPELSIAVFALAKTSD